MSERINGFMELRVYHDAGALDLSVFEISKTFPREEMYALTDQVRRSARSIGANMAEAWAKRRVVSQFECHREVREARCGDPAGLLRRSVSRNDSQ